MELVQKGKKIVISIIVLMLLIDIVIIAVTSSVLAVSGYVSYATYNLMKGIFRFVLTVLVLFFLYKGYRWAKWLMVSLLFLGGGYAVLSLISAFNIVVLAMAAIYICIGVILIFSKPVNDFFRYQKGDYQRKEVSQGYEDIKQ